MNRKIAGWFVNRIRRLTPQELFTICTIVDILLVLFWVAKDDEAGFGFLFDFPTDNHDTFMDYFNSIYWARVSPVHGEYYGIYPPLTEFGYVLLGKMLLPQNPVGSLELRAGHSLSTVITFSCALTECILYSACALLMHEFFAQNERGSSKKLSWLITGVMLSTLPFVYALERGNSVVICFLAILIFLYAYEREGRAWQETACISIAIAANIKVYPVIFLGMYLADGRFKDFWKAFLYSTILFIVPFAAFNGLQSFLDLLNNIFSETSKTSQQGFGQKVGLANLISFFVNTCRGTVDYRFSNGAAVLVLAAIDLLVIFLQMQSKKDGAATSDEHDAWRLALMLGSSITLMPSFSYIYNGLFTLPGIVLFLRDRKSITEKSESVIFVACLMTTLVIPYAGADIAPAMTRAGQYIYPVTATHLMASLGYCIIYISTLLGELREIHPAKKKEVRLLTTQCTGNSSSAMS